MTVNKYVCFAFVMFLLTGQTTFAQVGGYANAGAGMWGTGYSGGVQGCNQPWSQGTGAVSMSDEEIEERKAIQEAKLQLQRAKLERERAEKEMDFAKRKLERVFDSEIVEFLLDTHIELMNQCTAYKLGAPAAAAGGASTSCSIVDAQGVPTAADATVCGGKTEVPEKLKDTWLGPNGYCTANTPAKGGDVSSKICADVKLRPEDGPKYRTYSTAECGKSLVSYKKFKLKFDKANEAMQRYEDEIEERQFAIADAKERAKLEQQYRQRNTSESDSCIDCVSAARGASYTKPKRDWVSILGQVGTGLGLGYLGKQYDDRNAEYSAQLGYPPQQGYPTAVSMGFPFILGGVYGAINGTSGQGGFGCAAGMGGTGGVYGAGNGMNGPFGGAGGVYGPYGNANGGAFGYPQGMYGTPWGGGMYNPGYGAGGMISGPFGGFPGGGVNGGFAVNGMMNGGFMGMQMGGMSGGGFNMGGGFQAGGFNMGGFQMGGGMPMSGGFAVSGGGGYNMGGGFPAAGGFNMGGFQMGGGFPASGGFAVSGGGGFPMSGGMPMSGGGYNMGGFNMGGFAAGGGFPAAGGYNMAGMAVNGGFAANGGYNMAGMAVNGGFPAAGGYNMAGMAANGGFAANGGYMGSPVSAGGVTNGQYQLQMLQMQQQMQQQMMQQQMQYQQAQMQQQMQAYQRQMAVQQQAAQVQQEIASLQVRLQMLYSGAYTSGATYNTGTIPQPGVIPAGTTYPQGTTFPGTGSAVTVPAPNGR